MREWSRSTRVAVGLYLLIALGISAQQTVGNAPSNNFAIFRASFWHLVHGQDLYAWYLAEYWDLFKYTPTCALLFAPFALLPYAAGLIAWNVLNAMALCVAMLWLLPARAALAALLICVLEAVGAVQNAQSNALVAALIICSVLALERDRVAAGAAAVFAGASIKLFPLSSGLFGLVAPQRWRHVAWCVVMGVVFAALPLLVTSPSQLIAQYQSWLTVQEHDATLVGRAWIGGLVELLLGRAIPHGPVQVAGVLVTVVMAWLARDRWSDAVVRHLLLASLLVFSVVFNHMAESPSFVIAYAGVGIWWASLPRERWRDAAVLLIVLLGSVGGSDIVPKHIRVEWHDRIQLKAIVCAFAWFAVQYDLLRAVRTTPAAPALPAQ